MYYRAVTRFMRVFFLLTGVIFFIFFFKTSEGLSQDFGAGDLEKVSINLGWTHQFQFAGYYAAKEKGFYKDAGLNVSLISGTRPDNIGESLSGTHAFGVAPGALLLSDKRSSGLSILAAILQQSPVTLLGLKSNNIYTLQDLQGKDIVGGVEIKLMLASADVDLSTVTFHGLSTPHENLINGTFDAISYYITDHSSVLGIDSLLFTSFRPIEYGINFYGECLFTSKEEVTNFPELTQKMIDATIKGWEYAVANSEEIVDIILEKYPSELTRNELIEEAEVTIHSLMQTHFYDVGDMQLSKWNQMSELLLSQNIIDEIPDLASIIYVPAASRNEKLNQLLRILWMVLPIGGLVLLILLLYNWQLKKAVGVRTRSLEKSNLELDKFVYSVSHDIRSPLSSMQGAINLMRLDPASREKYLDLVESSIVQLNKFIGEILDYSKNSRTRLANAPVDVKALIENSIDELRYLNSEDKVDFIKKFNLSDKCNTDEWRLKIILSNLISNAIKYHDPGKESSFVKISASSQNKELNIQINDNGIGVEPQHLDNIYDMFYRATEESNGSGLGLYIVKEAVKIMKGRITINSEPMRGTQINLKIPLSSNGVSAK